LNKILSKTATNRLTALSIIWLLLVDWKVNVITNLASLRSPVWLQL
jgi:hypothetical protein